MRKFFKKYKVATALFIYLLLIGTIFYFAVKPLLSGIKSGNAKIQETLADQEIKKNRLGELPKLREQYEMAKKEEGSLVPLLTEDKAVELIEKMEKMAEDTGNEMTIEVRDNKEKNSVVPKKSGKIDEAKGIIANLPSGDYLEMKIMLSGGYDNLISFIKKIETMEYYADIISFDISAKPEEIAKQPPSLFESSTGKKTGQNQEKAVSASQETILDSTINVVFYIKK